MTVAMMTTMMTAAVAAMTMTIRPSVPGIAGG
jgi:hypothetical protein